MKYQKGTFVIIPNKDQLKGKPPEMLSVYFWLCQHANEEGICFPTKKTLSLETGCSHNTVDKYLKKLVEEGFVSITTRKKSGSKENTSNLYQIMLWDDLPQAVVPPVPPSRGLGTVSSINSIHLTTNIITLNTKQGKTPIARLQSLYGLFFKHLYGFKPKPATYPQTGRVFKDLLSSYSEIQLACLLIVYFNWQGMSDHDQAEKDWLIRNAHSIWQFKSNISKYEIYTRNVAGWGEEFEDDERLYSIVKEKIIGLSTS